MSATGTASSAHSRRESSATPLSRPRFPHRRKLTGTIVHRVLVVLLMLSLLQNARGKHFCAYFVSKITTQHHRQSPHHIRQS